MRALLYAAADARAAMALSHDAPDLLTVLGGALLLGAAFAMLYASLDGYRRYRTAGRPVHRWYVLGALALGLVAVGAKVLHFGLAW